MTALLPKVKKVTQDAMSNGSLKPLIVVSDLFEDVHSGSKFCIKTMKTGSLKTSNLENRIREKKELIDDTSNKIAYDVFRPFDKNMLVHQMSNYTLLLNKFPVFPEHLLLVTTEFAKQTDHLTRDDFQSGLEVMTMLLEDPESDSWIGFYNRGLYSGASQPHKHLQFVPLSIEESIKDYPLPLFTSINKQAQQNKEQVEEYQNIKHAFKSIKNKTVDQIYETYKGMLQKLDLWDDKQLTNSTSEPIHIVCEVNQQQHEDKLSKGLPVEEYFMDASPHIHPSYNILFTHDWILIIPRSNENFNGISSNSMGFLFGLFVKTSQEKEQIKEMGCLNFLKKLTFN
ncbi:sulfate adenylyltransferase [Acrasis kona]|uniref:Sulfate adenylyltransferase n=1 Tax=Acrasis kona TaxID=1008807 RepID=A0AAW2ZE18_9EUKA